jgi:hypothetical protein
MTFAILPTMEIAKKVYIKGPHAAERLQNLQKLANEFHNGNFSEMVNQALDDKYRLDDETGTPVKEKQRKK